MREVGRLFLVALLVVALIESPVMAAPAVATPLGVILQSEGARVGGDSAVRGTTVFDGDRLETTDSGLLQVRFSLSQAYFLGKSAAVVHPLTSPGFATDLERGTLILSSGQNEKFRVLADGATIQPSTAQATVAQVTWVSAHELILASRKGALEVSMGDEVKTIPDGASYRMLISPAAAASAASSPAAQSTPQGKNRFILVLIAAAIAATTLGLVLTLETPSQP